MKKKYIRIIREGLGSYLQPLDELTGEVVMLEFDGAEIGEKITLELVQMYESEYNRLSEFIGW